MKNLAFLKAHKINVGLIDEYCKLKNAGVDTIIVFDNKDKKFPPAGNKIVKLNIYGEDIDFLLTDFDLYEKSDLPGYYNNENGGRDFNTFMWYNSDYPYYLVYNLLPDYDYYWQIEYDVYCNGKSYKPFFKEYKKNDSDYVAVRLGLAHESWWAVDKTDWIWGKDTKRFACILPITRLSNRAVKYLYEKRKEHGEIYKQKMNDENVRWIYCEAFVATEICNNPEMKAWRLNGHYISDTPVINLAETRLYLMSDNKLYHPVK